MTTQPRIREVPYPGKHLQVPSGTNPVGNYTLNHSKHYETRTAPRAGATTSQISNLKTKQDLNNACVKKSLLYYEIFSDYIRSSTECEYI